MTSDELDPNLLWEPRWVGIPSGTHLSADGSSPLARSDETNLLVTHATIGGPVEDDEDNSDLLQAAAGFALGALLTIGVVKATPYVKAWWKERWAKKTTSSDAEPADDTSEVTVAAFTSQVEVALEDQATTMSSAEAQRRILEVLLAAAVIADNMRALSNARLEDGSSAELQSAFDKLTVPQVTDSLNRMLETDRTLLDEQASAELMRIFGGGSAVEGDFVPLHNDKIRNALRLPPAA